jgi:hypothetical protein
MSRLPSHPALRITPKMLREPTLAPRSTAPRGVTARHPVPFTLAGHALARFIGRNFVARGARPPHFWGQTPGGRVPDTTQAHPTTDAAPHRGRPRTYSQTPRARVPAAMYARNIHFATDTPITLRIMAPLPGSVARALAFCGQETRQRPGDEAGRCKAGGPRRSEWSVRPSTGVSTVGTP